MSAAYVELADLDDQFLLCKGYFKNRHAFMEDPSVDLSDVGRIRYATHVITCRCVRCGRERIEYLDRQHRRIGALAYRGPFDYPRTHRLVSELVNAELARRSLLLRPYGTRSRRSRAA